MSEDPTITTIVGDIETTMFDAETKIYGNDRRECIGFRHWWDRCRDGYKKILDFYACGLDGRWMTENQFLEFLSGLSIKGEFDELFDRYLAVGFSQLRRIITIVLP